VTDPNDGAQADFSARHEADFQNLHRNKRSITLDLKSPDGVAILKRMVERADILVENFRPDVKHRLGIDYETLSGINPRLIYASISGFGQDGPYAKRVGFDQIAQGMGGFMSITGERDDRPGGGPQKAGVAVSDLMTGMYATVAILAALAHRDRTGEGQYIDMALMDTMVAMLANMNMNYLVSGKAPGRAGNAHQNIVPYQVFAASDGFVVIAVGNDAQYVRFCEIAGCTELAADARFARNADRVRHREMLIPLLENVVRTRPMAFWAGELEAAGVPCGPINNIAQTFADPQVAHRRMRIDLPHAAAGHVPLVASPIRMSATPPAYDRPPPRLGEHTDEVLAGLTNASAETLAELRCRGVI
jgi:formyl-CoA transferase